jgi:hypothetical protein
VSLDPRAMSSLVADCETPSEAVFKKFEKENLFQIMCAGGYKVDHRDRQHELTYSFTDCTRHRRAILIDLDAIIDRWAKPDRDCGNRHWLRSEESSERKRRTEDHHVGKQQVDLSCCQAH